MSLSINQKARSYLQIGLGFSIFSALFIRLIVISFYMDRYSIILKKSPPPVPSTLYKPKIQGAYNLCKQNPCYAGCTGLSDRGVCRIRINRGQGAIGLTGVIGTTGIRGITGVVAIRYAGPTGIGGDYTGIQGTPLGQGYSGGQSQGYSGGQSDQGYSGGQSQGYSGGQPAQGMTSGEIRDRILNVTLSRPIADTLDLWQRAEASVREHRDLPGGSAIRYPATVTMRMQAREPNQAAVAREAEDQFWARDLNASSLQDFVNSKWQKLKYEMSHIGFPTQWWILSSGGTWFKATWWETITGKYKGFDKRLGLR
jgi:hypothetical protein